jgi:hypothetical protein
MFSLCACVAKPWTHDGGWVSTNPQINIGNEASSLYGTLVDADGQTIEIQISWMPSSGQMAIYRRQTDNSEQQDDSDLLLKGSIKAKGNTFTLALTQDSIYNNSFSKITFAKK